MSNQFVKSEKWEELNQQLAELKVNPVDLIEKFILGSGKGGQKVNKTASCVYLKHIPSEIEIKCSKSRSREVNRFFARRQLVEKLLGVKSAKQKQTDKIRKQKKKRAKRSDQKYGESFDASI